MLLFSLIISNCEDRVLFVLIHLTGVLCSHSSSFHLIKSCISFQLECCPNLIFLVPCLSRFNQSCSNSFLSFVLVIHSFATSKVHMVFLVSIFYRSALKCVPLCYVISFNLSTSPGFLVSLICRRSNLVLPLLFLFRFFPVPSQISGRDPLVVVECCNAPRPTLQKTSIYSEFCHVFLLCLLFYFCIASCHHAIMPFNF